MNQEVTRRHYLDAMGITAWAAKYQLPNALPTEVCEWEESAPAPTPPRERLQALLDDAPAPKQAPEPQAPSEPLASPSAVRALLSQDKQQGKPDQTKPTVATPEVAISSRVAAPAQPLKFELSCVCLEGRWLVLKAGSMLPLEQQLLANLLQAAGILRGALPEFSHFTWPQIANAFAVEDPLDEAREGLAAFIDGSASRQGWRLERLLWWGELDAEPDTESGAEQAPLNRILNVTDGQSQTLSLPLWQGPALGSLLDSTRPKRELWPVLLVLGQQWRDDKAISAQPESARSESAPQATDDY